MVVVCPEPPLTDEQTKLAFETLVDDELITKFPRIERSIQDPVIPDQKYVCISFYPTKGATPDADGVYGYMKVRGSYSTVEEASIQAKTLIQTTDSFSLIRIARVGYPFRCTNEKKYALVQDEVDVNMGAAVSEDVKAKMKADEDARKELKQREKKLQEMANLPENPLDAYITLHVTKSKQLMNRDMATEVYDETMLKIQKMDIEHPDFKDIYMDRFNSARQEVGGIMPPETEKLLRYMKHEG